MSNQTAQPGPVKIDLQQQQIAIASAALRGGVPRLFANGFIIAQTMTDLSIVLTTNGTATAVLNLPLITAKTLIDELQKPISKFEKIMGSPIKTMGEMQKEMDKLNKPAGK